MPAKVKICVKCEAQINSKNYLKCKLCLNFYDVTCTTNVSQKRFDLMTKYNRSSWTCHKCHNQSPNTGKNSTLNNPSSNARTLSTSPNKTAPKKGKHSVKSPSPVIFPQCSKPAIASITSIDSSKSVVSSESFGSPKLLLESDADHEEYSSDDSVQSLPNMSTTEDVRVLELKADVTRLTTQLASAHAEIDNLNSTISEMTIKLENSLKLAELYKQLLGDSRHPQKITPKKKLAKRKKSPTQQTADTLFSSLTSVQSICEDSNKNSLHCILDPVTFKHQEQSSEDQIIRHPNTPRDNTSSNITIATTQETDEETSNKSLVLLSSEPV